ncbi:MAG: hypothetical protein D4R45_04510 [Planctomycetaceae bacterium]|nr:MAG: hypothetical protein D4R45_04510 [Planctomycetaceae bacterium]
MKKLKIIFSAILISGIFLLVFCESKPRSATVQSTKLVSQLTVSENLATPTTSTFIEINGLNEIVNYADGSTRFDVDHVFADTLIKTGNIDLSSLTNTLGEALDLTDEVIIAAKFFLADSSGATCTLSEGASNSYPLFGTTYSVQLQANQSLLFKSDTVLIPVSATHKNITYTGSGSDAVLFVILLTADSYQ